MKNPTLRFGGLCGLLFIASQPVAHPQELVGAGAVIRQVEERLAKPNEATAKPDPHSELRTELKAFASTAGNLAPEAAAKQWLELVERATLLSRQSPRRYEGNAISPDAVFAALPPPAAWGELAKAIAARPVVNGAGETRELGFRLLGAALAGTHQDRIREITNLLAKATTAGGRAGELSSLQEPLSEILRGYSDDPDIMLKMLEVRLASGSRFGRELTLPNLVPQVGAAKTEAFLRKALVQANVSLVVDGSNETARLARKLLLELIDQLKAPQWGLVGALDAVEAFEALEKRFGATTNTTALAMPGLPGNFDLPLDDEPEDYRKAAAEIYYLLGLIGKGRTADAIARAKKFRAGENQWEFLAALGQFEAAGSTVQLDNFFHQLLTEDSSLPFWEQYVSVAAKAGQTERMLALVRSVIARAEVSGARKAKLGEVLMKALLAADQVNEGLVEMRRLIDSGGVPNAVSSYGEHFDPGNLGIAMARIGLLLNRPELTQEGLVAAKKWLAEPREYDWQTTGLRNSLVGLLSELGRNAEAESLLADALVAAMRNPNNGGAAAILARLAKLYHEAGRPNDVIALLERSPQWGVKDLAGLSDRQSNAETLLLSLHGGASPSSIRFFAGTALLASGQKESAARIARDLLAESPGLDRGYELLLAIEGSNALPQLDELFARDAFEERPLIWKAHLLRQVGRLVEAERTIRQAVAIDPSDGEQGRGDRMRVYSVLADIREARGDAAEAATYRGAVRAIRLSENADRFYEVGLLKRAVAMYQEALTHFADAYCIESRLALQLSAMGLHAAAENHYRRAYELMPVSFGRVESHCFGCEQAFAGERAQSVAEGVFLKLAVEQPGKPQVHYLLGYLRDEQERYSEARTNYLSAVRLDPDYLNAWKRLQGISDDLLMTPQERDGIALNILRLDPLGRHGSPDLSRVSDLAGLWNAVALGAGRIPERSASLFPLTASKSALEANTSAAQAMQLQMREEQARQRAAISPGRTVGSTPLVEIAGQLIMSPEL